MDENAKFAAALRDLDMADRLAGLAELLAWLAPQPAEDETRCLEAIDEFAASRGIQLGN